MVLKTIPTPNIANHEVENNLDLECWVEELEPCQKERNAKLQEERLAIMNKLEELIKESNAEVVYKGDLSTAIEVSEHVQKTIQGNFRCFLNFYWLFINVFQLYKLHKINHPWFLTVLLPRILNLINWWLTPDWVFWSPQTLQMVLNNLKFRYVFFMVVLNSVIVSQCHRSMLYNMFYFFCKDTLMMLYWSHYLCFLWHLLNIVFVNLDKLFSWDYLMFNEIT